MVSLNPFNLLWANKENKDEFNLDNSNYQIDPVNVAMALFAMWDTELMDKDTLKKQLSPLIDMWYLKEEDFDKLDEKINKKQFEIYKTLLKEKIKRKFEEDFKRYAQSGFDNGFVEFNPWYLAESKKVQELWAIKDREKEINIEEMKKNFIWFLFKRTLSALTLFTYIPYKLKEDRKKLASLRKLADEISMDLAKQYFDFGEKDIFFIYKNKRFRLNWALYKDTDWDWTRYRSNKIEEARVLTGANIKNTDPLYFNDAFLVDSTNLGSDNPKTENNIDPTWDVEHWSSLLVPSDDNDWTFEPLRMDSPIKNNDYFDTYMCSGQWDSDDMWMKQMFELETSVYDDMAVFDALLKKYYDTYYTKMTTFLNNAKNFWTAYMALKKIAKELWIEKTDKFKTFDKFSKYFIKWANDNWNNLKEFLILLKTDPIFVRNILINLDKKVLKEGLNEIKTDLKEVKELKDICLKSFNNLQGLLSTWEDYQLNPFSDKEIQNIFYSVVNKIEKIIEYRKIDEKGFDGLEFNISLWNSYIDGLSQLARKKKTKSFYLTIKWYKNLVSWIEKLLIQNWKPNSENYLKMRLEFIKSTLPANLQKDIPIKISFDAIADDNPNAKQNLQNIINWDSSSLVVEYWNLADILKKEIDMIEEYKQNPTNSDLELDTWTGKKINILDIPTTNPYELDWRLIYEFRNIFIWARFRKGKDNSDKEKNEQYVYWVMDRSNTKLNKWMDKNIGVNYSKYNYKPFENNVDIDQDKKTVWFLNNIIPRELWHNNKIDNLDDLSRDKIKYLENVKFILPWEGTKWDKAKIMFLNRMHQVYHYIWYEENKEGKTHKFWYYVAWTPDKWVFFWTYKKNIKDQDKEGEKEINRLLHNPLCSIVPKPVWKWNTFSFWTTLLPDVEDPKIWKRWNKNVKEFFPNPRWKYKNYEEYMKDFLFKKYLDKRIYSDKNDGFVRWFYFNKRVSKHKTLPWTKVKVIATIAHESNKGRFSVSRGGYENLKYNAPLEDQIWLWFYYVVPYSDWISDKWFWITEYDVFIDWIYPAILRPTTTHVEHWTTLLNFLMAKDLYTLALWKYFPWVMGEIFAYRTRFNPYRRNLIRYYELADRLFTNSKNVYTKEIDPEKYLESLKPHLKADIPLTDDPRVKELYWAPDLWDENWNLNNPLEYDENVSDDKEGWERFQKWIYYYATTASLEYLNFIPNASEWKGDIEYGVSHILNTTYLGVWWRDVFRWDKDLFKTEADIDRSTPFATVHVEADKLKLPKNKRAGKSYYISQDDIIRYKKRIKKLFDETGGRII